MLLCDSLSLLEAFILSVTSLLRFKPTITPESKIANRYEDSYRGQALHCAKTLITVDAVVSISMVLLKTFVKTFIDIKR